MPQPQLLGLTRNRHQCMKKMEIDTEVHRERQQARGKGKPNSKALVAADWECREKL